MKMHKNILVKFTLQITCQWMGIELYKLTSLLGHFYIEKWMNFLFFYSQTFFNHISLVFHYFEQFFFSMTCLYMDKWGWYVFGGYVTAATTVKKRLSIFRVIKVNLRFGELKLFQMAQHFNIIWYSKCLIFFNVRNFFLKKVKTGWYRNEKTKNNKKVPSDINFLRRTTTLPFKNFTLRPIFSKKSPQMPPNSLQGGLVYGNVTKVSF